MTKEELNRKEKEFENDYNKYMQMQDNNISKSITNLELAYIDFIKQDLKESKQK